MKKINNYGFLSLLMILVVSVMSWAIWNHNFGEKDFECWARLHTRNTLDNCQRSGFFDVFFSFHGNEEGFFLADGTWSCKNEQPKNVTGLINFDYEMQGDYYSIKMREENAALSTVFSILSYKDIKIKITRLNSSDYTMTLPNETFIICTED